MNRPITTLFLLSSIDGKISIGASPVLDFDKDFPKIKGLKEGLGQYYQIESTTDLSSFITGVVLEKIGFNTRKDEPKKLSVTLVVIDNGCHLNLNGVNYALKKFKKVIIVTNSKQHIAKNYKHHSLSLINYYKKIDFKNLFGVLKNKYKIHRITLQSGGSLNAILLREGLIDKVKLVFAPVLIGGKDTPSIISGVSIKSEKEFRFLKTWKLIKIIKLKNSYVYLEYKVNA